jgi:hypothetical protein
LISPINSPSPEELVPGHVFDTVAIKVFSKPVDGSMDVLFNTYVGNGSTSTFSVSRSILAAYAVAVKLNGTVLVLNTNYTVDYAANQVTFQSVPAINAQIMIISYRLNSDTVFDIDTFIGDESTCEFITRVPSNVSNLDSLAYITQAPYHIDNLNSTVYVDGIRVQYVTELTDAPELQYTLFRTTEAYLIEEHSIPERVGIRFNRPLGNDSLVSFMIDQLETVLETSQLNFKVAVPSANVVTSVPSDATIVRTQLVVNGSVVGHTLDTTASTVKLVVLSTADLSVNDNVMYTVVWARVNDVGQADALAIAIDTSVLGSTRVTLPKPVIFEERLQIVANGSLLTGGYTVDTSGTIVTIASGSITTLQVVAYTNPTVTRSFSYMMFKDMFNATSYVRLGRDKTTSLTRLLSSTDSIVYVADSSVLSAPSTVVMDGTPIPVPGIVEIGGERVEYYVKNDTTNTLSQLRRGTQGTGVPDVHNRSAFVIDIGTTEQIPYEDTTQVTAYQYPQDTGVIALDQEMSLDEFTLAIAGYKLRKGEWDAYTDTHMNPYNETGITRYAEYTIDWYATDFDYVSYCNGEIESVIVSTITDRDLIDDNLLEGAVVKVQNYDADGWRLFEKRFPDATIVNDKYIEVGRYRARANEIRIINLPVTLQNTDLSNTAVEVHARSGILWTLSTPIEISSTAIATFIKSAAAIYPQAFESTEQYILETDEGTLLEIDPLDDSVVSYTPLELD